MSSPLPVSAAVEIDADPARVWRVVSDVTRMPEWSPELRRLYPLGRDRRPRVGLTMLGINRRGFAVWPTTSKVVRLEPERAVAWKTRESGATWTYELERTGSGTRLSGRRDLPAYSLGTRLMSSAIGGAQVHDRELADGIRTTLQRIKAVVEAG